MFPPKPMMPQMGGNGMSLPSAGPSMGLRNKILPGMRPRANKPRGLQIALPAARLTRPRIANPRIKPVMKY